MADLLRNDGVATSATFGAVTSAGITTPDVPAGRLLVFVCTYETPTTSDITNTPPAGVTAVSGEVFDVATTTGCHLVVATKTAAGGPESLTWNFGATVTGGTIVCQAYTGADTATPWDRSSYRTEPGGSGTTTHAAPTLTPTVANSWGVAAFAVRSGENLTASGPLVARADVTSASGSVALLADTNATIAAGVLASYSATEPTGTAVACMFAGNLRQAEGAGAFAATTASARGTATSATAGMVPSSRGGLR